MKKKMIRRYVLLGFPFLIGSILYGMEIYNIFSSVLFFGGGYVFIKNICDYRYVSKNINKVCRVKTKKLEEVNDNNNEVDNVRSVSIVNDIKIENSKDNGSESINKKYRSYEDIPGLKSTRRYVKVRRRY